MKANTRLKKYHHGDLRNSLLFHATAILEREGLGAVSMRRLAESAGVSRQAAYHHFHNKWALLAAIAIAGFAALEEHIRGVLDAPYVPVNQRLEDVCRSYVQWACAHPAQYELMFGSLLWREHPDQGVSRAAWTSFLEFAALFQDLVDSQADPEQRMRLSQVSWATLHGLARLAADGVYRNKEELDMLVQTAVTTVLASVHIR